MRYQQNPPGVGLLEMKYVEADGQERKETYCQNVIGTKYREVNSSVTPLQLFLKISLGFVVACISY